MPKTRVVFSREAGGKVAFLDWFGGLSYRAKDHCAAKLTLLRDRATSCGALGVNYRMLYFFDGQQAIVLSHGFDKQQAKVPKREIEQAKARMGLFESDPKSHTHVE